MKVPEEKAVEKYGCQTPKSSLSCSTSDNQNLLQKVCFATPSPFAYTNLWFCPTEWNTLCCYIPRRTQIVFVCATWIRIECHLLNTVVCYTWLQSEVCMGVQSYMCAAPASSNKGLFGPSPQDCIVAARAQKIGLQLCCKCDNKKATFFIQGCKLSSSLGQHQSLPDCKWNTNCWIRNISHYHHHHLTAVCSLAGLGINYGPHPGA